MKEKIDLAHIHAQEKALEKAVKEAQQALSQRQRQLREFGQEIKKEIAGKLKAGGTTGDPLIDEIIPLLGIEKATIDSILGFNEALLKGKEILIAVPRRECTKHVFMPTPGTRMNTLLNGVTSLELCRAKGSSSNRKKNGLCPTPSSPCPSNAM